MTQRRPGTPNYTFGFSGEMLDALRSNTAERQAAHLLPLLEPGMRVLDVGCGPGTISAGLARAVAPGELHGVDMEASQVEMARTVAQGEGLENAAFRVADAVALPFEEGFFDVVHCHNLLIHVPDTRRALAEAKRVLKRGGLLACREVVPASCFTYPSSGVIERIWGVMADMLAADDGHPHMGKDLKTRAVRAGFTDVRVAMSYTVYGAPEEIAYFHRFIEGSLLSREMEEAAVKYGATTQELFDRIRAAYDRWKDDPGAVAGLAYGEVLARKG